MYNGTMKIKIIERSHELDLEDALNEFLTQRDMIIKDVQYAVSMTSCNGQLEYSFSCFIVYSIEKEP